jgi:hypothetical protein
LRRDDIAFRLLFGDVTRCDAILRLRLLLFREIGTAVYLQIGNAWFPAP